MHTIQLRMMGSVVHHTFHSKQALLSYIDWLIDTDQPVEEVVVVMNKPPKNAITNGAG